MNLPDKVEHDRLRTICEKWDLTIYQSMITNSDDDLREDFKAGEVYVHTKILEGSTTLSESYNKFGYSDSALYEMISSLITKREREIKLERLLND